MRLALAFAALLVAGCHAFETIDQEAARRCSTTVSDFTQAEAELKKLSVGSVKSVGRCKMTLERPEVVRFEVEEN